MIRVVHIMLRVLEEERSIRFYSKVLGLHVVERLEFDDFTLVYLADSFSQSLPTSQRFELELTINHGRTDPYVLGDGYGHLAISVDDIKAEYDRLQMAGYPITPIKTLEHNGKKVAQFFFLTDPDGYRIEMLQRSTKSGVLGGASGRF